MHVLSLQPQNSPSLVWFFLTLLISFFLFQISENLNKNVGVSVEIDWLAGGGRAGILVI